MKTIAVLLSSSQHFRNTGMFSVELAAYQFFKKNFPECRLTFYVPHISGEKEYPVEYERRVPHSTYRQINASCAAHIRNADLIVFWSDFFHTRHYVDQYLKQYTDVDIDLFYKTFFLEGAATSVLRKSIAFGNSLMFLDRPGSVLDRHQKAFNRLYENMTLAMPRDSISWKNLCDAIKDRNSRSVLTLGIDPAFLLEKEKPRTVNIERNVGLFIGRRTEIKSKHVREIKRFAKETKRAIYWIDWMRNTESFFMRAIKNPKQARNLMYHCYLSARYRRLGHEQNPLFSINRYDMIITDTYHLAVNAIRAGIPVFCIGTNQIIYGKDALDLHDKKKETLMKMIGIDRFYGEPSVMKLKLALDQDVSQYIDRVSKYRAMLLAACKQILEGA